MVVTKKKGNIEQAEITQPTDFQRAKKQALNRATTQRKNVTTSQKRNVVVGLMSVSSPGRNKKRVAMEGNYVKRGSGTKKNLQKTKYAKVNNIATEMDEGMRKTITKNKTSGIIHI